MRESFGVFLAYVLRTGSNEDRKLTTPLHQRLFAAQDEQPIRREGSDHQHARGPMCDGKTPFPIQVQTAVSFDERPLNSYRLEREISLGATSA
jgi:hypothetical protein